MVIELEPSSYGVVSRMCNAAQMQFPLIRAVLERQQQGVVLVDTKEDPRLVLVTTNYGFTYVFGSSLDEQSLKRLVTDVCAHPRLKGRYLLWYDPPRYCQQVMDSLSGSVVRKRTRVQLRFNQEHYPSCAGQSGRLTAKTLIQRIDQDILSQLKPFKLDIGGRFWRSEIDFLQNGFGFVIRVDQTIASVCYTACVANGVTEIDAATLEQLRGIGCARIVTHAFLRHCIETDITPNWDCFDYNAPSYKLAKSLGFEDRVRYPLYSINT